MGTTPPKDRQALHAYLSDDAKGRWIDFTAEEGVSASALLEVIGLDIETIITPDIVKKARRVDAERRRRGRPAPRVAA